MRIVLFTALFAILALGSSTSAGANTFFQVGIFEFAGSDQTTFLRVSIDHDVVWLPDGLGLVRDGKRTVQSVGFEVDRDGTTREVTPVIGYGEDEPAPRPTERFAVAVSPNGRRVAYITQLNFHDALVASDLDGGNPTVLWAVSDYKQDMPSLASSYEAHRISWSNDGSSVYLTATGPLVSQSATVKVAYDQVVRVAADGSQTVSFLTAGEVASNSPSVSPDGSTVVFHRDGVGLMTMRSDGSDQRPVPGTRPSDAEAAWSPDGQRLFIVSTFVGGLLLDPATGTRDAVVASTRNQLYSPQWRPRIDARSAATRVVRDPPGPTQTKTRFYFSGATRPSAVRQGCVRLSSLRWRGWGTSRAVGRGRKIADCRYGRPPVVSRGSIVLTRRVLYVCGTRAAWFYSRAQGYGLPIGCNRDSDARPLTG